MIMKKAVVIGYTMDMGGAEVALINVLNVLKEEYEIDLILLEKKGVLLNKVPKGVNIKEVKTNLFKYVLFRFIPFFRKRIINKMANQKYDLAIAFMEGRAATLIVDLKQNCKKIAWIHNDVDKFDIGISEKEIKDSYNKVDLVVAVSKHSKDSFCKKYDIDSKRVKVVYNLINEEEILKKASEQKIKKEGFTFVNVAKMRPQKRHDRLIEAAKILKDKGYKFTLWLIGNGPLEKEIQELIQKNNLEDCVKMLGLKENPYPYVASADYFVLSSDHEGYPVCLLEALLLKTKIISTDVSGAKEMLKDNKYGIIVDVSLTALVDKMQEVMDNNEISLKLEKNLKSYKGNNEDIRKDLKKLFDMK